jgi:hypothetical protein
MPASQRQRRFAMAFRRRGSTHVSASLFLRGVVTLEFSLPRQPWITRLMVKPDHPACLTPSASPHMRWRPRHPDNDRTCSYSCQTGGRYRTIFCSYIDTAASVCASPHHRENSTKSARKVSASTKIYSTPAPYTAEASQHCAAQQI